MPEWFIQMFGIVFLAGICGTAIFNRQWWLMAEAAGVAFAMIGVRSLLRSTGGELGKSKFMKNDR